MHATRAEKKTGLIDATEVMQSVIKEIGKDCADIDMFMPYEKKEEKTQQGHGHGQVQHEYKWLMYRHENRVVAEAKNRLIELMNDKCKTSREFDSAVRHITANKNSDMRFAMKSQEFQEVVNEVQVLFQVHESRKSMTPEYVLDEVTAPFFTVESMMWLCEGELRSRFGVPLELALEHVARREMHLACSAELIEYLDEGLDDARHMVDDENDIRRFHLKAPSIHGRLAWRLLKYKRYGFDLRLDHEELKCKSIPAMIKDLMCKHIVGRNNAQKKMISKGVMFATEEDGKEPNDDEREAIRLSKNALAVQGLYNDYVANVLADIRWTSTESKSVPQKKAQEKMNSTTEEVVEIEMVERKSMDSDERSMEEDTQEKEVKECDAQENTQQHFPWEICELIAQFAARSDPDVYSEDAVLQQEIANNKQNIEDARREVIAAEEELAERRVYGEYSRDVTVQARTMLAKSLKDVSDLKAVMSAGERKGNEFGDDVKEAYEQAVHNLRAARWMVASVNESAKHTHWVFVRCVRQLNRALSHLEMHEKRLQHCLDVVRWKA